MKTIVKIGVLALGASVILLAGCEPYCGPSGCYYSGNGYNNGYNNGCCNNGCSTTYCTTKCYTHSYCHNRCCLNGSNYYNSYLYNDDANVYYSGY